MKHEHTFILDTHVWLWLAFGTPGKIKADTLAVLEQASRASPLWVSVISVWEIALLESKGRIRLPMNVEPWIAQALSRPEIRLLGLENIQIAIDSCNLPGSFHSDPADRLLVASARNISARLVTHDQKIIDYSKAGYVHVLAV